MSNYQDRVLIVHCERQPLRSRLICNDYGPVTYTTSRHNQSLNQSAPVALYGDLIRVLDDSPKQLSDEWKRQRAARLAVEERMAKAVSRVTTRVAVRTHSRAQGEPERRAALSVRQHAQRVR